MMRVTHEKWVILQRQLQDITHYRSGPVNTARNTQSKQQVSVLQAVIKSHDLYGQLVETLQRGHNFIHLKKNEEKHVFIKFE